MKNTSNAATSFAAYLLFEIVCLDEKHFKKDLPVAALVALDAPLVQRLLTAGAMIKSGAFARMDLPVERTSVALLHSLAFDSDGTIAEIPGFPGAAATAILVAGGFSSAESAPAEATKRYWRVC